MPKISAPPIIDLHEAVHNWFELSYAQYLTIPRSVLQSMPPEWQARFVQCLDELDELIDWRPADGRYWVELRGSDGRFASDPLMDYERGRRRIPLREPYLSFPDMLKWLVSTMEKTAVRICVILPDAQRHAVLIKDEVINHFNYHAKQTGAMFDARWTANRHSMMLPNGSGLTFGSVADRGHQHRLRGIEFDHLLVHHTVTYQVDLILPSINYTGDHRIFFDR